MLEIIKKKLFALQRDQTSNHWIDSLMLYKPSWPGWLNNNFWKYITVLLHKDSVNLHISYQIISFYYLIPYIDANLTFFAISEETGPTFKQTEIVSLLHGSSPVYKTGETISPD